MGVFKFMRCSELNGAAHFFYGEAENIRLQQRRCVVGVLPQKKQSPKSGCLKIAVTETLANN